MMNSRSDWILLTSNLTFCLESYIHLERRNWL